MDIAHRIGVRISEDGLEAYALVRAGPAVEAGPDEITEFLKGNDIVEGLLPEALARLVEVVSNSTDEAPEAAIARGKPPENGHDGFITYEFDTKLAAGKLDSDGSIDFRERGLVNNVQADQPLAAVTPPNAGVEGISVRGKPVRALPGREPDRPTLGRNVRLSEDQLTYLATIEGHASLNRGGNLEVNPELVISGDLDYSTGNIDFVNNVTVRGGVKSGFIIRAGGDITVRDDVEGKAQLRAARSVVVGGAIRTGTDQPRVEAGEDVAARSIENSWVKARGNVRVRQLLLDARVECVGKFICERGEVRGSSVEAVGGAMAHNVGTEDGAAANTLTAGLTRRTAARLKVIEEKLAELRKAAEAVFAGFRSKHEEVLDDAAAMLKLSKEERQAFEADKKDSAGRQETITDQAHKLREEADELKNQFHERAGSVAVVTGTAHPPCTVWIGEGSYPLRPGTPANRTVFYAEKDSENVVTEPYDPAKMVSVGEDRTYVGAGEGGGDVKDPSDLAGRVKNHAISAPDLAAEIGRYAAQGVDLATSAVRLAAEAVKMERYRKPAVYGAEAQAWLAVAALSDGDARKRAAHKALEVCLHTLQLDESYSRAHGTMGRAYYLLGEFNESVACHRKAVAEANRYRGEAGAALVHREFAGTLADIAEALTEKAPEKAAAFWQEAQEESGAYLAKEPNGPEAEACREIISRADAALSPPDEAPPEAESGEAETGEAEAAPEPPTAPKPPEQP